MKISLVVKDSTDAQRFMKLSRIQHTSVEQMFKRIKGHLCDQCTWSPPEFNDQMLEMFESDFMVLRTFNFRKTMEFF